MLYTGSPGWSGGPETHTHTHTQLNLHVSYAKLGTDRLEKQKTLPLHRTVSEPSGPGHMCAVCICCWFIQVHTHKQTYTRLPVQFLQDWIDDSAGALLEMDA